MQVTCILVQWQQILFTLYHHIGRTCHITGPNYGIGCNVAVMKEGHMENPLGEVEVDSECAVEINKNFQDIELDFFSYKDHSLEVQIPMLQEIYSHKFKILPIILINQDYQTAKKVGSAIAKIGKDTKNYDCWFFRFYTL